MNPATADDPQRDRLRDHLEAIKARAQKAQSWRDESTYYTRLINRDGYVPIKTRLSREDIAFLATAREDLLAFAELSLRLVELHQPRDAGGISSDPAKPIRRCRSCMWRWPCPTFRAFLDTIGKQP